MTNYPHPESSVGKIVIGGACRTCLYIHRRLSSFAKGWQGVILRFHLRFRFGVCSEAENLGVGDAMSRGSVICRQPSECEVSLASGNHQWKT